ncbi:MAG: glycosyltransferase family 4 protein [Bacillota bacterium]
MKILFLTAEPPWPPDQGDKLRNYHLLKALAAEDEVTLVSFTMQQDNSTWKKELAPYYSTVYTIPLTRRRMILNTLFLPHLPVTMAARTSSRMAKLLRELTNHGKFDIAFACQLKTAGYLKHCTCSKVADLTDVVSLYRRRMLPYTSRLEKLVSIVEVYRLAYWEKKVAQAADLTLLVSPLDAAVLRKMAPKACIDVIPNAVDLNYFKPLPDQGQPVIVFYGHLRYPPNADGIKWFCTEIFPKIREEIPNAELHIIGKEPPAELVQYSNHSGITLTGYVPDIRPFLAQASVVVTPIRFGAGIRNKVLEAFAVKRPVVSTSLGCEGLSVEPGIHLEVADTPSIFAEAVIRLLRDPTRRSSLAENSRHLVKEKYEWNVIGKKLRTLLLEIRACSSIAN